ncbi:NHLP leader peptide family RiPP precursor [Desulfoscipio gibsoniae]
MKRKELEEKLIKKAWTDSEFKKQLLADPKAAVEKEVGKALPENMVVKAVEETADTVYIKIPRTPEELSDDEMDNVAGGFWCISFSANW